MNKKILIGSVLASVIIVLASLTSVVSINAVRSDVEGVSSPLFATRMDRAIKRDTKRIDANYIGEGQVNILFTKGSSSDIWISRALKTIEKNPELFRLLMDRLSRYPKIAGMLKENGISQHDLERYVAIIKNDSSLLEQDIKKSVITTLNDGKSPLQLSTSNPLGCYIVALIVLPIIAVVVSLLIVFFTLRVFQCLGIEEIAQGIFDQLIQGLIPP